MGQRRDLGSHPLGCFNCQDWLQSPSQSLTLIWALLGPQGFLGSQHSTESLGLRIC